MRPMATKEQFSDEFVNVDHRSCYLFCPDFNNYYIARARAAKYKIQNSDSDAVPCLSLSLALPFFVIFANLIPIGFSHILPSDLRAPT